MIPFPQARSSSTISTRRFFRRAAKLVISRGQCWREGERGLAPLPLEGLESAAPRFPAPEAVVMRLAGVGARAEVDAVAGLPEGVGELLDLAGHFACSVSMTII